MDLGEDRSSSQWRMQACAYGNRSTAGRAGLPSCGRRTRRHLEEARRAASCRRCIVGAGAGIPLRCGERRGPEHESEFNAWYEQEHLPGLASVPGAIRAARYRRASGSPRYLACYDLLSLATLERPERLAARHTAWSVARPPAVPEHAQNDVSSTHHSDCIGSTMTLKNGRRALLAGLVATLALPMAPAFANAIRPSPSSSS